jgi:hypothetical protein
MGDSQEPFALGTNRWRLPARHKESDGFTLKPFNELPLVWKRYFYDDEDCRKANDMLKDIFENRTISWAHTDNKFEMFMGAFQQMEQYLR